MRSYPALLVSWPTAPLEDDVDRLMAAIDDTHPTAVEDQPRGIRVFFATEEHRDAAAAVALHESPSATVTTMLVPDENWAERSQAALHPVRIGRVVVAPPWTIDTTTGTVQWPAGAASASHDGDVVIAIQPSMGFGTGHHASTRLCLDLLQRAAVTGEALDIGTGSGVLAIAAWRLGAERALGIDVDRDALVSAAENIELNDAAPAVTLDVVDITLTPDPLAGRFSLVFANITGAMLTRCAPVVAATLAPGGRLIISGFQVHEREDVTAAFVRAGLAVEANAEEDTWVAAALRRPSS